MHNWVIIVVDGYTVCFSFLAMVAKKPKRRGRASISACVVSLIFIEEDSGRYVCVARGCCLRKQEEINTPQYEVHER